MEDKQYLSIVAHYENCLEKHGDSHLGVDWPKLEDAQTRYRVMLEVIKLADRGRDLRLLDFGCGASHLYEYIRAHHISGIEYAGLDLSKKFVELSKNKFPENKYYCLDLLEDNKNIPNFDYVLMNGVFTEKGTLSFAKMFAYFQQLVRRAFEKAETGLAFNVMSKHVDWERDDLFHLPFDALAAFLRAEITRNFVMRCDYGLYEYTTYLYR
jgi:SAM-dependent methyltransferase